MHYFSGKGCSESLESMHYCIGILTYFRNPYTILLNTIPILLLIVFLFLVCNRLWISIGITSIVVIVLTLINYFKILFRDDPLMVEDLSLFLEMKNMTGRYKIHANSTMAFWILSMVILVGIVWKIRKVVKIRMKLRTRIIFLIITEYSRAVTPQIRQAGNRLSGLAETAYASLLA